MMYTVAVIAGLQMTELMVILAIVLLLFGPKALPKLARSLGSSIREFKDATTKVTESVMAEDEDPAERPTQPRGVVEARPAAKVETPEPVKEKVS